MNVSTIELVLSVALGVICLPAGLFLGLVPLKADLMTAKQTKSTQMVSFVIALVFIGLMLAGYDLSTWCIVAGLVIGFAIAKIPPIHAWALRTWTFLQPKSTENKRTTRQKRR